MPGQTSSQTNSQTAAAPLLTLEIERTGDSAVVRCHGRLVSGVNNLLYTPVTQLMPGARRVILDLTDLTHVDSTGLGTLVRLYVHARSEGCSLELIHLGKQLLGVTNLLSVFTIIGEQHIKLG